MITIEPKYRFCYHPDYRSRVMGIMEHVSQYLNPKLSQIDKDDFLLNVRAVINEQFDRSINASYYAELLQAFPDSDPVELFEYVASIGGYAEHVEKLYMGGGGDQPGSDDDDDDDDEEYDVEYDSYESEEDNRESNRGWRKTGEIGNDLQLDEALKLDPNWDPDDGGYEVSKDYVHRLNGGQYRPVDCVWVESAANCYRAIQSALSFNKHHEPLDMNYNSVCSGSATLRTYGRINEKSYHSSELQLLGLYRTYQQELTLVTPQPIARNRLYVMVDDSGSMSDSQRVNRLAQALGFIEQYAKLPDVEVYTYSFERFLHRKSRREIHNGGECKFDLNGGATNVEDSLKQLIEWEKLTIDDSVLVINDGDDNVSKDFHPHCKLTAYSVAGMNNSLRDACKRCGGAYIIHDDLEDGQHAQTAKRHANMMKQFKN